MSRGAWIYQRIVIGNGSEICWFPNYYLGEFFRVIT